MQGRIKYEFSGHIWKYNAANGWYFVSLPVDMSKEIRNGLQWQEEGWGRMKVTAIVKNISWETAIWFDTKKNTYLLPLKAEIRKKGGLKLDDIVSLNILI